MPKSTLDIKHGPSALGLWIGLGYVEKGRPQAMAFTLANGHVIEVCITLLERRDREATQWRIEGVLPDLLDPRKPTTPRIEVKPERVELFYNSASCSGHITFDT